MLLLLYPLNPLILSPGTNCPHVFLIRAMGVVRLALKLSAGGLFVSLCFHCVFSVRSFLLLIFT